MTALTPEEVAQLVYKLRLCRSYTITGGLEPDPACVAAADALTALSRERLGYQRECDEVAQTLGKVLGYPWYKDDPANFPGATEADGVCLGEHVAGTIASEAAARITELSRELEEARKRVMQVENTLKLHAGDACSLNNEIDQWKSEAEDNFDALTQAQAERDEANRHLDAVHEALGVSKVMSRPIACYAADMRAERDRMRTALANIAAQQRDALGTGGTEESKHGQG